MKHFTERCSHSGVHTRVLGCLGFRPPEAPAPGRRQVDENVTGDLDVGAMFHPLFGFIETSARSRNTHKTRCMRNAYNVTWESPQMTCEHPNLSLYIYIFSICIYGNASGAWHDMHEPWNTNEITIFLLRQCNLGIWNRGRVFDCVRSTDLQRSVFGASLVYIPGTTFSNFSCDAPGSRMCAHSVVSSHYARNHAYTLFVRSVRSVAFLGMTLHIRLDI